MAIPEKTPIKLDGSNACGLEGVEGRPSDCPNNPMKHPENHRPQICSGCLDNPELWKVAEMPLNKKYIRIKQTKAGRLHPWQIAQAKIDEARIEAGFEWKSLTDKPDSANIIFDEETHQASG